MFASLLAASVLLSRRLFLTSAALPPVVATLDAEDGESTLVASTEARRQLRYYGAIEAASLLQLNSLIDNMAAESNEPIHLHIQSGGGELLPALYTADLIASSPAPVYTYVDGYAASAATLITVSAARRFMTPHSVFMVHQLSAAHSGKYDELKQSMQNDELLMEQLMQIYMQHSNIDAQTLRQLLATDKYLSATECLHHGFVDSITGHGELQ